MQNSAEYKFHFKRIPKEQRPRERLVKYGPEGLRNGELMAVILNTGYRKETVMELSHRIIKEYGSRAITQEKNVGRLMENLGIPLVKACQVVACFELGRRFFEEQPARFPIIRSPEDAYKHLEEMGKLKKEQFRGLYLNTRTKIIHDEVISIGTLAANLVHPREVFQPAIEYLAAGMVIAHNHPSGDPSPSKDDLTVTRQMVEVGKTIGIEVLDHIIIGNARYESLKDKGLM